MPKAKTNGSYDKKLVDELVKLVRQKEKLESELADVAVRLAEICGSRDQDGLLVKQFESAGIQNVKTKDGTVYLARDIWATVLDNPALNKALQRLGKSKQFAGVDKMIKPVVNPQTFTAWVREQIKAAEEKAADEKTVLMESLEALPAAIRPVINLSDSYRVRFRRS